MIGIPLALTCFVAQATFFGLVFAAGFVGRKLASDGEFSWGRYASWLVVAVVGAVLLVASRTTWVFLCVSVLLVLWVLMRAAADAQATTLREKVGFLQLYAALILVQYSALVRLGVLSGTRASPWFSLVLEDHLAHLVLPLFSPELAVTWAHPSRLVHSVATSFASHLLLAVALSTFGLAAFVYAHFAEHATPKIGLSLLPAPTVGAVSFAALSCLSRAGGETSFGLVARCAAIFLTPYLVAEGLWVVHRLLVRLKTRAAWTSLLALLSPLSPALVGALAAVGWVFHLVRLRAFQPILGDVERSASRPRIRTALIFALASSVVLVLLGAAEGAFLRKVSPGLGVDPDVCAAVTFTPTAAGVVVASPARHFTMDAEETAAETSTPEGLATVCARRGARLCTSDEWTLACVCSYPNESEGGAKISANDRLVYRIESDRKDPGGTTLEIRDLLARKGEVVSPFVAGSVLVAGPSDAVD
ncbi:MAG TPA: hypothetical protein VF395_07710, partial [Polyangiaceae bacterium]